jgi:hypothetical protein
LKHDVLEGGARREDHGSDDFRPFLNPTETFDERERERKGSPW